MIKKLMKNDFNKNALTLITGTTLAQALPIAISPILTRIYTPEEFGLLGIFLAITAIFGSIANGRYELAIVLPEKEEDAINLVIISILIAMSFSIFLFVTLLVLKILNLTSFKIDAIILYLVPLSVLAIGIYNALNYYHIRIKKFKLIAETSIYRSISLSFFQVSLGFLNMGYIGLVISQLISSLTSIGKLGRNFIEHFKKSNIKKGELSKVAKKYNRFPKYSIGGVFINTFSQNINNFIIPSFFVSSSLGNYSLIIKMLGTPSVLIGNSLSQVYYQKASSQMNISKSCRELYIKTTIKLVVIAIPIFSGLYFVIDNYIVVIFGEEWKDLERYGKILLPLFLIRFVSSTMSITLTVFKREKEFLFINVMILLIYLLSTVFVVIYNFSIEEFLKMQTIILGLFYLILIFRYYYISKG